MPKPVLFTLLGIFGVMLVIGYLGVIPFGSSDPREVPTETATSSSASGESGDAATAGQAIYEAQCSACHTTDGSDGLGPTWQGLWMSQIELEDGTTVVADENYIIESIREPAAKVHNGFPAGVMQPYAESQLNEQDLVNLIAYIQTLQ